MAVSTVKFTLNGTTVTLTYNSSTGKYEGTMTAPSSTSWGQTNHKYSGSVTVTDTAGNTTTKTASDFSAMAVRVLETTKPTITPTYPSSGAYITNSKPTITWQVTDAGSGIDTSTISLKVDSTTYTTSSSTAITTSAITNGYSCSLAVPSALSEGSHTLYFNVSDNDGNAATQSSFSFKIDTVPPTLTVSAPTDNYITNNATLTVKGTTNDATSSPVTLTVNGSSVTVGSDGSWSTTVTLATGSNTITVVATDSAGKTTTVTRSVTLDTTAPTISAVTLTPNPVNVGATITITVTCSD